MLSTIWYIGFAKQRAELSAAAMADVRKPEPVMSERLAALARIPPEGVRKIFETEFRELDSFRRSSFNATSRRQSSFVGVDAIKYRDDIIAAGLLSDRLDSGRRPVAPAKFFGKRIPDRNLRFVGPQALRKTPFCDFFICAALVHASDNLFVCEIEKLG